MIAAGLAGAVIALAGTLLSRWRQYRQSRREEWFGRVQWAAAMANQTGTKVSAAGLSVLDALAKSNLANPDDLVMLQALNANAVVDELEQACAQSVDDLAFTADDEEDDNEEGSHDEGNNT